VNPSPSGNLDDGFSSYQSGVVGDFTASRKRRVPEIPMEKIGEYYAEKKPFPWHWGNCIYFEWFSAVNGRVVIEAADYHVTVSPEAAWEMTIEEEEKQRESNARAIQSYFEQLGLLAGSEVLDTSQAADTPEIWVEGGEDRYEEADDDDAESWKQEPPLSEEEADQLLADSDRLTDRLISRLTEAGEDADFEAILEEELRRKQNERATQDPATPEDQQERDAWIEEVQASAQEYADDPDFQELLRRRHPLSDRARELSLKLMEYGDTGTWVPDDAGPEHPALDFIQSVMKAGGKLAGALDGREWPIEVGDCAMCIAWLKRARSHLEEALCAGDFCRQRSLVPDTELVGALAETKVLLDDVEGLIAELRERLARGFD
jgi:hypothetical protein